MKGEQIARGGGRAWPQLCNRFESAPYVLVDIFLDDGRQKAISADRGASNLEPSYHRHSVVAWIPMVLLEEGGRC